MSDYGYVAERARQAFASLARSEQALNRNPSSASAQINFVSRKKAADQAQAELLSLAEINRMEVCDYRLMPRHDYGFALARVSRSYLSYQNLFSQIHDSLRNGKRSDAHIGQEALQESALEIAYTYAGSLGVVLLAQNDADFFSGVLDKSVDMLFEVINTDNSSHVKQVSNELGAAVLKRLNDWCFSNMMGGFDIDLDWKRSDGIHKGALYSSDHFKNIVDIVSSTSDEKTYPEDAFGMLVGINLKSGNFHFSVPNGKEYKGTLGDEFPREASVEVGVTYVAFMSRTEIIRYATGATETKYRLEKLQRLSRHGVFLEAPDF